MPICCCFLPSPVTCTVIGTVVTFVAIYQLILDYEKTTMIAEDETAVRYALAAIHLGQAGAGLCALVAALRLSPRLLRASAFAVGPAGAVYFVEVLYVEKRVDASSVVWASAVVAVYIYMASLLCASASVIEMMLADHPPQPDSGEAAEAVAARGGRPRKHSAEWYVSLPVLRFPPPAHRPPPPADVAADSSQEPTNAAGRPDGRPADATAK